MKNSRNVYLFHVHIKNNEKKRSRHHKHRFTHATEPSPPDHENQTATIVSLNHFTRWHSLIKVL
jgi:hypothetical protein